MDCHSYNHRGSLLKKSAHPHRKQKKVKVVSASSLLRPIFSSRWQSLVAIEIMMGAVKRVRKFT